MPDDGDRRFRIVFEVQEVDESDAMVKIVGPIFGTQSFVATKDEMFTPTARSKYVDAMCIVVGMSIARRINPEHFVDNNAMLANAQRIITSGKSSNEPEEKV